LASGNYRVWVAESEPAARGIEIHQVLASYINHLVGAKRVDGPRSVGRLDESCRYGGTGSPGEVSGQSCVDPEKILATELHIALDENFLPIQHPGDASQTAEYEGTLDLVMLHSLTDAEIDDWKSYFQIIDAEHIPIEVLSFPPNVPQSILGAREVPSPK